MAEIVHDQALTQELTGTLRRSSTKITDSPVKAKPMEYTNLTVAAKAAAQHRQSEENLVALEQVGVEVAGRIEAVADAFDDLDAEQARRIRIDTSR